MARWPWPRRTNARWSSEASAESAAWLKTFRVFSPEEQAVLDRCNSGLLASLAYPDADKDHLRITCDLMNLFYVFEEQTDISDASGTQALADIVIDVVRNPERPRPDGEPILGEIVRQFWVRALPHATPSGRDGFIDQWERYASSTVAQARDRDEGRLRTVEEYLPLRRYTVGVEPAYALAALSLDIPPEISKLPLLEDLRRSITEIVCFDNDLLLYCKEYAAGEVMHNILTLVMNEKHLNLDAAVAWVVAEHAKRVDRALTLWREMPSLTFDSADTEKAVAAYLDHLIHWPRVNEYFTFESSRYFGKDGPRVKRERVVELLSPEETKFSR